MAEKPGGAHHTQTIPFALASPVHSDFTLRKSRFIGCVEPCAGREAALARVAQLRSQHPAATHVCWALMAGGHSAANDDGEPGGTARSLGGRRSVGCKPPAAVHFSPSFCPIAGLWGGKVGKNWPR